MSNYITMSFVRFASPLSIEEIRERYKAALGEYDFHENYVFEKFGEGVEVIPNDGNYGEIWDDPDEVLRVLRFVSTVMALDEYIEVALSDSYDEKWGHLVLYTNPFERSLGDYQVFDIAYEPTVKGQLLDKFMETYRKERPTHATLKKSKEV